MSRAVCRGNAAHTLGGNAGTERIPPWESRGNKGTRKGRMTMTATTTARRANLYTQAWYAWQANRQEALTSPHNYLAPLSTTWVAEGETKTIKEFPGIWSVKNDTLTYEPIVGSSVTNEGKPLDEPISFTPTAFGEQSLGYIDLGDVRAEVNSQTDRNEHDVHRFWIRIKDPKAQPRANFVGIDHFDPDPAWSLPAKFIPAGDAELDIHDSVVTTVLQSYKVLGTVEFEYQGSSYSLIVSNVFDHAYIFFSDGTSDSQTAGIGRILELSAADVLGLDHIDFNYAFNYPCSFSLFCTCPIPSKRNHLPFAVTAGEKTPHEYQY